MGSVLDQSLGYGEEGLLRPKPTSTPKRTAKTAGPSFTVPADATPTAFSTLRCAEIHRISCELEKKRLECAIMIQAALADQD